MTCLTCVFLFRLKHESKTFHKCCLLDWLVMFFLGASIFKGIFVCYCSNYDRSKTSYMNDMYICMSTARIAFVKPESLVAQLSMIMMSWFLQYNPETSKRSYKAHSDSYCLVRPRAAEMTESKIKMITLSFFESKVTKVVCANWW